jgi:hypothetical protein
MLLSDVGTDLSGFGGKAPSREGGHGGSEVVRSCKFPFLVLFLASAFVICPLPMQSMSFDMAETQGSASSLEINAIAAVDEPSGKAYPPADFAAIPGPTYVDLNWSSSPDDGGSPIVAYYLYRSAFYEDTIDPFASAEPTVFSYRDYDVTVGQRYFYQIRAVNSIGPGYWGGGDWVVVGATVPGVPLDVRAWAGGGEVNLTWDYPSFEGGTQVEGYNIYRGISPDNLTFLESFTNFPNGFTDEGLVNGVKYYYQLTAYNYFGEGLRSDIAGARPNWAPRDVSVIPTSVEHCGPIFFTLSWSHPAHNYSEVVCYRIYIGRYGGLLATVENDTTSYTGNVSGWGGATLIVASVNAAGEEVFSSPVWISGPYCEGVGGADLSGIVVVSLFVLALVVVPLAIVLRRRR